jgi:hypothetical protein
MKAAKITLVCLAVLCVNLVTGCALYHKGAPPRVYAKPYYETLYPYYVEICAITQIRSNFAEHGGSPGHAVMYLKGACRDEESDYPRLKLCDPDSSDLTSEETGTGISVNKMLRNVNWLAVPGKQLFFHGNLEDDEGLNVDRAIATIEEAADDFRIFDGVEIHGQYMPPEDDEEELLYLAAAETLGTDFALKFGRTIYCARLPVTQPILGEIIDNLNDLNDEYALGEVDYNWSGYSDNCAHTLHNSLAAGGVWDEQPVRLFKLRQLFYLSVPANEFVNLALRGNTYKLEDPWRIYNNEVLRKTLMEHNWLPTRHGALITIQPVHQNNELYETDVRIFVLEPPLLRNKSRKIGNMYRDPRYRETGPNLLWFRERYEEILRKRPDDWHEEGEKGSYEEFRRRYYEYIEEQLADVEEKLIEASKLDK